MTKASDEVPRHGAAFHQMMLEIDGKLIADGQDIAGRPIFASMEISRRYGLIITHGDAARIPPELRENAALGKAIHRWYQDTYGERLKVDMSAGDAVVLIDGDLYSLKIPRFFGQVTFTVQPQFLPPATIGRSPAICNVVQLIDGMTPSKAGQLSEGALKAIWAEFSTAMPASYTLENTPHGLISAARGDVATAVADLMHRHGRYGASKWASLQAAEKIMKAAIELQGGNYTLTHNLKALNQQLKGLGVDIHADAELDAIQCTPGIRYGEEPCTREEALDAHQASLRLVNLLRNAGAKFQLGLG